MDKGERGVLAPRGAAITSKQKKVWQAARSGNSPTKQVTLRQKDR